MVDVGTLLASRYRLTEQAAAGGMGRVFRALDERDGAAVAVKVLSGTRPRSRSRFEREASLLRTVSHPGVVRYLDHGASEDGELFLVMEWLRGQTLRERIRRHGRVEPPAALALLERLAGALAAVHAAGIVHRDVKPSNILLVNGAPGGATLLDFGVARGSDDLPTLTGAGDLVGTPAYMAPEQVRSDSDLTAAADVYGLGCVAFEALTGRRAFEGGSAAAVIGRVLFERPAPVRALVPDVSPELAELVEELLAKTPADRPPDGRALLARIGHLDARVQEPAPRPPPEPIVPKVEQRVASVVVARLSSPGAPETPLNVETLQTGETSPRMPAGPLGIAALCERFAARYELLRDEILIAVLARARVPTDQAYEAATFALELRALLGPDTPISVATGRTMLGFGQPSGEALERAIQAVTTSTHRLTVDRLTSVLLGDRLPEAFQRPVPARTPPGPCVGRSRELAVIRAAIESGREEGTAQAVLVVGEAGIGKSHLTREVLAELAGDPPVTVLQGHGDMLGGGGAFGIVARALRAHVGVAATEAPEVVRARLRERLAATVPEPALDGTSDSFEALLGVSRDAGESPATAGRLADHLRDAWKAWLGALAVKGLVVMVLEDVHWADAASLDLVDATLRDLADRPIVVLATARPEVDERFADLFARRQPLRLNLGPLARNASRRLAREVLGQTVDDALVDRVAQRSAGHPFVLGELARAARGSEIGGLPDSVLGMVQARLEVLGDVATRALQAASVFGQTFWLAGVEAVCAAAGSTPSAGWIAALVDEEFVSPSERSELVGEREFTFTHALVREATYELLSEGARRRAHLRAAAWLEERDLGDARALAEHCERGGARERAATWYLAAAGQALEASDMEAVVALAERGSGLATEAATAGRLAVIEVEGLFWLARSRETRALAERAAELLPTGTEDWFSAVWSLLRTYGWSYSDADYRDRWLAAAIAAEPTDERAAARQGHIFASLATSVCYTGEYDLARDLLRRGQEYVDSVGGEADPVVMIGLCRSSAELATHTGRIAEALDHERRGLGYCRVLGRPRDTIHQLVNVGFTASEAGCYEEALEALDEAHELAATMGSQGWVASVREDRAFALSRMGRLDEAEAMARSAAETFAAVGESPRTAGPSLYLAEILRRAGRLPEALDAAREAVATFPEANTLRIYARAVWAQLLLDDGQLERALQEASEALEATEALGGGIEKGEARVRLTAALALQASGDEDAARDVLGRALERLEIRARGAGDEGGRRRFLEGIEEHRETLAVAGRWSVPFPEGLPED